MFGLWLTDCNQTDGKKGGNHTDGKNGNRHGM